MPIETQKQVPPATPQLVATMKAPCAPGLIVRVDIGSAEEDAVLDGDGVEVAGARPDEGERRRRLGIVLDD